MKLNKRQIEKLRERQVLEKEAFACLRQSGALDYLGSGYDLTYLGCTGGRFNKDGELRLPFLPPITGPNGKKNYHRVSLSWVIDLCNKIVYIETFGCGENSYVQIGNNNIAIFEYEKW